MTDLFAKNTMLSLLIGILICLLPPNAFANSQKINPNPLKAKAYLVHKKLPIGSNSEIRIDLDLAPHHHAYLDQFKLKLKNNEVFQLSKFEISPVVEFDDKFSKKLRKAVENKAQMKAVLGVSKNASVGVQDIDLVLTYQACAEEYCLLPQDIDLKVKLTVLAGESSFGETSVSFLPKSFAEALERGWFFVFAVVFFGGILTSFTPCIFPMIPITLAILGTRGRHHPSKLKGFSLSLSYVLGISITYAFMGLIAATTGSLFGSALGHPAVVVAIALVFFAMGLSMYGLFEINAPAFIQNKLGSQRTDQGYWGALVAGLVAGIVASPCVGPVLISVLAYVAQTQNKMIGFFLLFTFAWGFGLLFLVLGTFSQLLSKLPKAGTWMNITKFIFGTTMILMGVYYLIPVWPQIKSAVGLKASSQVQKVSKNQNSPPWQVYSDDALAQAKADGRPVIIDFFATWCGACIELEEKTFSTEKVKAHMANYVWLKFDATHGSTEFDILRKRYSILGLPSVQLYDANGVWLRDLTITGFLNPDEFIKKVPAGQ